MAALVLPLPPTVERVLIVNPEGRQAAVDAAVRALRGSRSLWPVDTGRSKRAWRRLGSGERSMVYNPLSYTSYVEAQNGNPGALTLRRHAAGISASALSTVRIESRPHDTEIRRAARERERIETDEDLYAQYLANRRRLGRRAPPIPRRLRDIDRRIRREASRV